jgi:dipeptidyl aminopeptidase/acylaminoacyl peptidase
MKMLPHLLALVLAAGTGLSQAELKPGSNLIAEGIPAVPGSLVQEVRRYTEFRSAGFAGWHPKKLEMLIGTRFGNTAQIHQVTAPLGMRRQLTFFEEPVVAAGIDRIKGDFFLFTRDQGGSEFSQLYRYDFADGRTTLLSDGGRSQNGGVAWSKKGDVIVYGSTRRNGADRDLYIMNPRDPKSERLLLQLTGGGWGVVDWSPDGRTLIINEYISVNESHLWTVDIATGTKAEFTPRSEKGVAYSDAAVSSDGKGVFLTTDKDFEFSRLAYMDLASRKIEYLTTAIPHDVSGFSMNEERTKMTFVANEDGLSQVYLMDVATRKYQPLTSLPRGMIGGGSWHRDGRHIAFGIGSVKASSDVHVLDLETGQVVRWTDSELGGVVASELSDAELIKWKSFDGLVISGFYVRPAAKFTGKRPVIINIHGGPEGQALPNFQGRTNYLLNELGIATIYPNVRGSTGFGKTFVALDNGFKREDSVKDIGALLDWIATRPELDKDRVMITGGSYGGYMTLACAILYNDRIRCSLDVVGISNFVTFLQNTESYRRDLRRVEYGDEREPAMREFMLRTAPTTNAAKITKPIFIVQGANDPRVPRTEAVQMVETVRKNGTKVWYLEAKDEGHGFRKKGNADFQFYATVLFIREHLLK